MITKLFLFWVLGLLFITFVGTKLFPLLPNKGLGAIAPGRDFNYLLSLAQWDGGNYLHIASEGFSQERYFAFAPVYPYLVKILSINPANNLFVALFVSVLSFLLFLTTLYKHLCKKYTKQIAMNTVVTYIAFPSSFFCLVAYSESLFLFLILLAVIYLEKRNMFLSAIFAGVAALTRFVGVFFIISQVFWVFKNRNFQVKNMSFAITFLPIMAYCVFLFIKFKNPFLFFSVQGEWGRYIQDPLSTIFSYLWSFITTFKINLNDLLDFLVTVLFIAVLTKGIKKISGPIWIFSILAILIPASTGTLIGIQRYALASVGGFILIGQYLGESKVKYLIWSISLALQCFLASLFIAGHWVA